MDSLQSDYILTARAKGLTELTILLRHALRNSVGPALSMTGLQVGLMFAGFIAVRRFTSDLAAHLARTAFLKRSTATLMFFAFSAFATALAVRVWWSLLPILGGGQ